MNHAAGAIVIPLSLPQHLAPSFSTELSRLCLCADDLFFQQPNSPPESPHAPLSRNLLSQTVALFMLLYPHVVLAAFRDTVDLHRAGRGSDGRRCKAHKVEA